MKNSEIDSDGLTTVGKLKRLLLNRDKDFWQTLTEQSLSAATFNELIILSSLRKKAVKSGFNAAAAQAAMDS